jgi:hypothetical protein
MKMKGTKIENMTGRDNRIKESTYVGTTARALIKTSDSICKLNFLFSAEGVTGTHPLPLPREQRQLAALQGPLPPPPVRGRGGRQV